MLIYTIGYGGRAPTEFLRLLQEHGIRSIADVRLRPDRASMGCYVRAKSPDKGIQRLLSGAGIAYESFLELGNEFRDSEDWEPRYRELLEREGEARCQRLLAAGLPEPICLLCAEKDPAKCHRRLAAEFLEQRGHEIQHIV